MSNKPKFSLLSLMLCTAFVAIGLSHVQTSRKLEKLDTELETRNLLLQTFAQQQVSDRLRSQLDELKVHRFADLVERTESELIQSKGFGETSLVEIRELLKKHGLRLKDQ